MSAEIIKLPYNVTRGAFSRMSRKSKNGTPEERAAKAAATQRAPADVVAFSVVASAPTAPPIDRRKLRGNPLRDKVTPISFAATIVGRMYTADLRAEPIDLNTALDEQWASTLRAGIDAAKFAACELEKAAQRLHKLLNPSEISAFPVNLPVSDLGQSVLNIAGLEERKVLHDLAEK